MVLATPYTPVFPPLRRTLSSTDSTSCDSNDVTNQDHNNKALVERLKERYILLASLPQDELCPPSRQASPDAEKKIEALRLRMRKAREFRFPHDPLLTLTCSGLRGGDWVGEQKPEDELNQVQYRLPDTEEQWFQWEREMKAARDRRSSERKAEEDRRRITAWSDGVENTRLSCPVEVRISQNRPQPEASPAVPEFPVVNNNSFHTSNTENVLSRSPYQSLPLGSPNWSDPELVARAPSPVPSAPFLDPLPNIPDTFSAPNSPPLLPQPLAMPALDDILESPSFALKDAQISTPARRIPHAEPVLQLSSPVSPPRSLGRLAESSHSTKRPRENVESLPDLGVGSPHTPPLKKARSVVEPITPASVPRQSLSHGRSGSPDVARLPTLTDLLATARKSSWGKRRFMQTPSWGIVAMSELSPSQPTHSSFRPQFQSTQPRARSSPPSPTLTGSKLISPTGMLGSPSNLANS